MHSRSWHQLSRLWCPIKFQKLRNSEGYYVSFTIVPNIHCFQVVPKSILAFMPDERQYVTLGTDGFGRSDTRATLRKFFEVDAGSVSRAALRAFE